MVAYLEWRQWVGLCRSPYPRQATGLGGKRTQNAGPTKVHALHLLSASYAAIVTAQVCDSLLGTNLDSIRRRQAAARAAEVAETLVAIWDQHPEEPLNKSQDRRDASQIGESARRVQFRPSLTRPAPGVIDFAEYNRSLIWESTLVNCLSVWHGFIVIFLHSYLVLGNCANGRK